MSSGPDKRANRRRGEIEAVIDGQRRVLVLTLGGLAELESAFDVDDLMALAARFESGRISSVDATTILAAGLRGGGYEVTAEQVSRMQPDGGAGGWIGILAELLAATFSTPGNQARPALKSEAGRTSLANPPRAQASLGTR